MTGVLVHNRFPRPCLRGSLRCSHSSKGATFRGHAGAQRAGSVTRQWLPSSSPVSRRLSEPLTLRQHSRRVKVADRPRRTPDDRGNFRASLTSPFSLLFQKFEVRKLLHTGKQRFRFYFLRATKQENRHHRLFPDDFPWATDQWT